ncbi:transglycosylase SLT domain-containing protein [Belliella kenyensis]|uniref:Transglycosylase SLT domain-containing protein n=1 Tax=Belliella kenyensis TaxID=1472724 RepID=A0ABV8EL67_9BACT|nr:lytic transglycosylase domain-containing protein [Belliella kenyensis]MCH7400654.1 transglycosylase SLT domain-containing protein [Belliella kenyensis]MDN3602059.1 transglycosylase SLT domain-containing protein [Belliella kenyensis]
MKNIFKSLSMVLPTFMLCSLSVYGQELYNFNSQGIQDELIAPNYQYDYIPDFTFDEVAKKIKAMKTDMPFELNDRIFSFINYFAVRNREYTRMVLQREAVYFPMFDDVLDRHDMPSDIKYLSIIESGLNPRAKSRVGAMGLWQFMPATGKMYSLHANNDVDDRMDPELSTDAAAKYLKSLYKMFGNWELALAAYNCGPGNVRKAIRKSGGKQTFWGVYDHLPKETRSYVPQFQAMMYIMRHAADHNLHLEEPTYPIAHRKIQFNQELDLEELAALTNICVEDLERLNPSIQNRMIPSSHKHIALKVPASKADFIAQNKDHFKHAVALTDERKLALRATNNFNIETPKTTTSTIPGNDLITYRVKNGDVLGSIAKRHGTSVTNIKTWNNLNSNTIKVGQNLKIYTKNAPASSSQQTLAENTSGTKTYTVQPGDSLWLISKKLDGVTIDQIKKLNNLNSNQIKPGQKLIIG